MCTYTELSTGCNINWLMINPCLHILFESAILGAFATARHVKSAGGITVIVYAIKLASDNKWLIVAGWNDKALGFLAVEGFRVECDNLPDASSHDEIEKRCLHNLQIIRHTHYCYNCNSSWKVTK